MAQRDPETTIKLSVLLDYAIDLYKKLMEETGELELGPEEARIVAINETMANLKAWVPGAKPINHIDIV
jgi:hypothetical protein